MWYITESLTLPFFLTLYFIITKLWDYLGDCDMFLYFLTTHRWNGKTVRFLVEKDNHCSPTWNILHLQQCESENRKYNQQMFDIVALREWLKWSALIRIIDWQLLYSYTVNHHHLILHVTSVSCYSLSSPISGRLCLSLSSTTCCQGSPGPIPHCLRPTSPTSAFVSQHHGVLHLQHCAIHHRSR